MKRWIHEICLYASVIGYHIVCLIVGIYTLTAFTNMFDRILPGSFILLVVFFVGGAFFIPLLLVCKAIDHFLDPASRCASEDARQT